MSFKKTIIKECIASDKNNRDNGGKFLLEAIGSERVIDYRTLALFFTRTQTQTRTRTQTRTQTQTQTRTQTQDSTQTQTHNPDIYTYNIRVKQDFYHEAVKEIADHILNSSKHKPKIGIICGSGLGSIADKLVNSEVLPYESIPNFPVTSVPGHAGRLVLGILSGVPVLCLQGRVHYYEGQPLSKNFGGNSPLRGINDTRFGPLYPSMTNAYDKHLRQCAKKCATEAGFTEFVHEGILHDDGGTHV
ncbi:Purine nucleoside phosphorylase [Armadillidium nasatum]|uniref:Purine nucleoside phosphorylase n=1 Tax=Armadillidium nasatum TaxID=96803 RepID=A0A5N5SJM4_9CRUS|nr:Purine nucleoside phosphorylase [Armadillidium nasatum]